MTARVVLSFVCGIVIGVVVCGPFFPVWDFIEQFQGIWAALVAVFVAAWHIKNREGSEARARFLEDRFHVHRIQRSLEKGEYPDDALGGDDFPPFFRGALLGDLKVLKWAAGIALNQHSDKVLGNNFNFSREELIRESEASIEWLSTYLAQCLDKEIWCKYKSGKPFERLRALENKGPELGPCGSILF